MKKYRNVLVHGNFEVMHTGHVRLFAYAKELGKKLLIGLSVIGLSSEEIARREDALRSSSWVDDVIKFTDLVSLIKELKPDIVVKGREFINSYNVEEDVMAQYGGQVIYHSGQEGVPQTELKRKVFDKPHIMQEYLSSYLHRNLIDIENLEKRIDAIANLRVLVVGDVIIDQYTECQAIGMSQESISLVAKPIENKFYLGGAGIVAAHCTGFGCRTDFLTILGNDEESRLAEDLLAKYGVTSHIVRDPTHPTVLKQRFRSGPQVLFRLNRFRQEGFTRLIRSTFNDTYKDILKNYDCVIFSDFSYGVFEDKESRKLVNLAKQSGLFVSADSQSSSQTGSLESFYGADLITPTEREARIEVKSREGLYVLSQEALKAFGAKFIFLTLGSDGILMSALNFRTDYIPALNDNPIDLAGAGDSLLSVSTLMLAQGSSAYEAGLMGSIAAAMQVSTLGNSPLSVLDLKSLLREIFS